MSYLEITEVVLLDCNILNNDYQQESRVLNTLVLNRSFGQLLDILSQKSELLCIEVWFADENSKPL